MSNFITILTILPFFLTIKVLRSLKVSNQMRQRWYERTHPIKTRIEACPESAFRTSEQPEWLALATKNASWDPDRGEIVWNQVYYGIRHDMSYRPSDNRVVESVLIPLAYAACEEEFSIAEMN